MATVRIEAFDVPADDDAAFLADWAEARTGATLHRALRADVRPRFVALGTAAPGSGDAYEVVHEDGEPAGAGGAVLIERFAVPAGGDERFTAAWEALRARLAPRRGYLGARLHRGAGTAQGRFVAVVRWSSPLMHARTLQQPEVQEAIAALPFPGRPALYLPVPRGDA